MKKDNIFRQFFKLHYNYRNKESIILRDFLSLERTRLANERTLLSYLRAALYLLIGGFALFEIRKSDTLLYIGYIAVGLSMLFVAVGIYRYFKLKQQLHTFYLGNEKKQQEVDDQKISRTTS